MPAWEELREACKRLDKIAADVVELKDRLEALRIEVAVEDAVRPDGPETDKGGLIGQQPY